jgi:hypothetical protein
MSEPSSTATAREVLSVMLSKRDNRENNANVLSGQDQDQIRVCWALTG